MKKKVIFDCDNTMGYIGGELDDGIALLYIFGSQDLELLGITTTFGNGKIDRVMKYTKQLLKAIRREEIPLFKGASKKDFLPTEAAQFLVDQAKKYPGEISLLATAPLGNLRAAGEIDEDFFRNLKEIILMGGHLHHPYKIGNVRIPDINLNFDIKAAFRILHAECPVTVINSELCEQVPLKHKELERISFWPKTIRKTIEGLFTSYKKYFGLDFIYIWDVLVPVYLTNPDLFDKNLVRIIASSIEDINGGHLVATEDDNGVLINMPSKILDKNKFMNVVIETWRRFHSITMNKNTGYNFNDD